MKDWIILLVALFFPCFFLSGCLMPLDGEGFRFYSDAGFTSYFGDPVKKADNTGEIPGGVFVIPWT